MELTSELIKEIFICAEGIYVIEEESKTIVYVNDFIARGNQERYLGHKCYQALLGKDSVCTYCPKIDRYQEKSSEDEFLYSWDFFDTATQRWMKIKNRLCVLQGKQYRVGNINMAEDMMNLSREAIQEMAALRILLEENTKFKAALEFESMRDKMTRLYNRNQYIKDLETTDNNLSSAGVLFFDLNNLKAVNDQYRHSAGDMLIKRIAESILSVIGENMRGYRIGGDEFVVIYKNCSEAQLDRCRESILLELNKRNEGEIFICSVAVGSSYSNQLVDIEKLTLIADRRMYVDKQRIKLEKTEKNQSR